MFKSKKTAWLTIVALLVPTTLGMFGASAAQAAASSTTLSTFTVNGTDAGTGTTGSLNLDVSTLNVNNGVLSTDVVATATDAANTDVTIAGDSNLKVGSNTLTVTVTDKDDATNKTVYTRTLNVLNNDNSADIVVNQDLLINGESTEVDWGTTSVPVVVTPTDSNATVTVNGTSVALVGGKASTTVTGLTTGDNTVTVVVTAANGEADESILTVVVDQNTDTSATITVEGIIADDGDTIPLDTGTTDPDIEVTTTDVNATVDIVGGSDLIPGENRVDIYVTAEDGVTFQVYNLTLMVALDDDASATISVNGAVYGDGDQVILPYQTTSVNVSVSLGDPDASYVIDGNSGLLQGDNDLLVTVYAPDGVTSLQYTITLTVSDPDVTLSSLKVNGTQVADQGSIVVSTTQNTLTLVTTDSRATVSVDGGTYNPATGAITLELGSNDIAITVTGDDKATTREYDITVGVIGIEVEWEGTTDPTLALQGDVITVPGSVEMVTVAPTTPLTGWIAEVEGDKDLDFGNNTVTVTFTSPDNVVIVKSFTVFVGPADLTLSTFTVGEEEVTLTGLSGTVTLDPHTTSAVVEVETTDDRATFTVTGGNNLVVGNNNLVVVVTGADGRTATYTVNVYVTPSDNNEIDSILINGVLLDDGADYTEVEAGSIAISVDPADEAATAVITVAATAGSFGGSATYSNGVITGSGYITVSVVVTAENGVAAAPVTFNLLATKDFDVVSGSNPSTDTLRVGTYASSKFSTVSGFFPAGTKLSYQWLADGVAISGKTTSRLLLTADDLDREVRPVVSGMVSGVKKTFVGQKLEVSKGLIALSSTPAILGKPAFGGTLKAIPKKWSDGVDLAYQWYVNGVALAGASGETFDITSDNVNVGDTVKVAVTGTADGYDDLTKVSSEVTLVTGSLRITDKPTVSADSNGYVTGATLTVTSGGTNSTDATVDFQWYRNGVAIAGAMDAEYEATTADFGKKLSVTVSYSAFNFTSTSITLKTPTIKVGTLDDPDAAMIGLSQNADKLIAFGGYSTGAATSSVKYTWYRNGRAVLGQTSSQYTLSSKDAGAVIAVKVVANYTGYKSTSTLTSGYDNYQVDN